MTFHTGRLLVGREKEQQFLFSLMCKVRMSFDWISKIITEKPFIHMLCYHRPSGLWQISFSVLNIRTSGRVLWNAMGVN